MTLPLALVLVGLGSFASLGWMREQATFLQEVAPQTFAHQFSDFHDASVEQASACNRAQNAPDSVVDFILHEGGRLEAISLVQIENDKVKIVSMGVVRDHTGKVSSSLSFALANETSHLRRTPHSGALVAHLKGNPPNEEGDYTPINMFATARYHLDNYILVSHASSYDYAPNTVRPLKFRFGNKQFRMLTGRLSAPIAILGSVRQNFHAWHDSPLCSTPTLNDQRRRELILYRLWQNTELVTPQECVELSRKISLTFREPVRHSLYWPGWPNGDTHFNSRLRNGITIIQEERSCAAP